MTASSASQDAGQGGQVQYKSITLGEIGRGGMTSSGKPRCYGGDPLRVKHTVEIVPGRADKPEREDGAMLEQGPDLVWLHVDDIPDLIKALQAVQRQAKKQADRKTEGGDE